MASVYTKTGDNGETGLLGGSRVQKDDTRVSCYGTLDEANSMIGLAYSMIEDNEIRIILRLVQKNLFTLGAELASDCKGKSLLNESIQKKDINHMEEIIDKYMLKIGQQKEFIIPGKTTASAALHVSRTIIRRAERLMMALKKEHELRVEIFQYINRLSDLLFVLARVESELICKD